MVLLSQGPPLHGVCSLGEEEAAQRSARIALDVHPTEAWQAQGPFLVQPLKSGCAE